MALSHTDTNLSTFKVNKFPSKAAFDDAVSQSLISSDELSLVEGEENLCDLNDVAITSPTDGQVLTYDGNSSEWVNSDVPTELPKILSGDAGKVLKVNSGETGVEWGSGGSSLPNNVTYFSSDSGVGIIPSDGIRLEMVQSASSISINPDVVTVISGDVGTTIITLDAPSDNLAHVWDIIMTTSSSPSITITSTDSGQIKYPVNFYWGASRDVEVSIVGMSGKYFVRYGEFA